MAATQEQQDQPGSKKYGKKSTNRLRRRQAKKDPEDAPRRRQYKGYVT